jgi:hypothetical protein
MIFENVMKSVLLITGLYSQKKEALVQRNCTQHEPFMFLVDKIFGRTLY